MMNRKLVSLALSLMLLTCCVGTACAESTDLTPYGAYAETITITTGKFYTASLDFLDPADTQGNNSMTRLIKERLNIDVQVLWESDEYSNKLAMEFAADSLPDMFVLQPSDYLLYR